MYGAENNPGQVSQKSPTGSRETSRTKKTGLGEWLYFILTLYEAVSPSAVVALIMTHDLRTAGMVTSFSPEGRSWASCCPAGV